MRTTRCCSYDEAAFANADEGATERDAACGLVPLNRHTQQICRVAETHALDGQSTFLRTTEPHTTRQGMSKTRGSLNSERCPCDRKPEHCRFRRRKRTCRYACPFVVGFSRPFVSITTSWTTTGYRCSPIESRSMPSTGCPRCYRRRCRPRPRLASPILRPSPTRHPAIRQPSLHPTRHPSPRQAAIRQPSLRHPSQCRDALRQCRAALHQCLAFRLRRNGALRWRPHETLRRESRQQPRCAQQSLHRP